MELNDQEVGAQAMSDPVDTGALRGRAALIRDEELSRGVRWLTGSTSGMLSAAADEVDRLRASLDAAPHSEHCQMSYLSTYPNARCTCWKAEL
jgi:hypothetical protein